MHIVSGEELTKSFGITFLFRKLTFHIEEGDKIALVARNGNGKSTFLKILAGKEIPEKGKLWIHKDYKVFLLEQDPELQSEKTILENIFDQDTPIFKAIKTYESLISTNSNSSSNSLTLALEKLEQLKAWNIDSHIDQVLSKLKLTDLNQKVSTLSGGQSKRLALAKILIDISLSEKKPILLLDEPTNHLDIEIIEWLEVFLSKRNHSLILVTHDQYFLDATCNEIWELEQEKLFIYKGDYSYYMEKKCLRLNSESANLEKEKNRFKKELEWIKRQPKARTSKSKSRLESFKDLKIRVERIGSEKRLELKVKVTRLGGKILELKKINKSFEDKLIFQGFNLTLKYGEKIGIIGKNGIGKSSLLNLIAGIELPDSGIIHLGDTIVLGYFSQFSLLGSEDIRVIDFVKGIAEFFQLTNGVKVDASEFLERFLFPPEKQNTLISRLSGGEKRKLYLLSILFKNPNFLLLDEPTNDFDLPTLKILEEFLLGFQGCLLLVSHDRYFLDKLVDHILVFEDYGIIKDFPGNYSQFRKSLEVDIEERNKSSRPKVVSTFQSSEKKIRKGKLDYKTKREKEILEREIIHLEDEKNSLIEKLTSECSSFKNLHLLSERLGTITSLIENKEERWLELSQLEETTESPEEKFS